MIEFSWFLGKEAACLLLKFILCYYWDPIGHVHGTTARFFNVRAKFTREKEFSQSG